MKNTRIAYGVGALALIAVLGFLIAKTRSVDFDGNNDIVATLRQLKQVDAEWNVDVLRSKTGLNNNYDPVASPLPLIESLEAKLQEGSEHVWGQSSEGQARLSPLLAAFKTAMDRKIALIERFKSQNAILRNSSRFLPVAAGDLAESTRASTQPAAARARVEELLNTLLADTMAYNLSPESELKARVEEGAAALQRQVQGFAPEVRERAEMLGAHVATIVKQQQVGGQLLAELAALPTARAIDDLSVAQAQEHDKLLLTQQRYAQALVAYAALLLGLLAAIGRRLYKSYRLLNATNSVLKRTNEELKESQVYMVQTEKMSALGQMVAGIAHEINTPLAYVKGTFDVLGEQLAPVKELAQRCHQFTQAVRRPDRSNAELNLQLRNVDEISRDLVENGLLEEMSTLLQDGVHGIDQISEIVVNLKNFSRLDRARVSEFSVQEGLESTLLLARNLLKNTVDIRREFEAVPAIHCSPSQINQVFLNIVTNAAHAMEGREAKGVITLRTVAEGHDMVRVEIQDNGCGIPKDVLPKIFDPFFTTKAIGRGTGMGLSISYKIVQQHGGRILVDTEEGVGTVFSILLPIRAIEQPAIEGDRELLAA
ncbi:DAHL domain-containing protein [Ideonella sp. A 288]|uniref:DAHL domain-containing protein n=1 Tax=Ideonella sp. A 288 TaxID=1962181 RepID=UPI000B4B8981|nr:DAHL domain-containing protein [Ideonella sp. A 288]